MAIIPVKMANGVSTTGNYTAPGQSLGGTAGTGWQLTYTTTYAALSSSKTDAIAIPANARGLSAVYLYGGAATATLDLEFSNNTQAEVAAGTAIWGPAKVGDFPQSVGGTTKAGYVDSPFRFVRGSAGGTGNTGADTITICVMAVSRIDS